MLKTKQSVTFTNVESIYVGWSNQLEASDANGNEVSLELNDELVCRLADKLAEKAKEIREKQVQEARETLEALDESTETAD